LSARAKLGVLAGTAESRDVARETSRLERAEVLPLPGDVYALLPDERGKDTAAVQALAHVHRVPQRNLWLWYWWTSEELTLVAVTNVPPT
jgi:hypothetical protein